MWDLSDMRIHRFLVIAITGLGLSCSGGLLARDWSSYTSENFTIYTDERERIATELLEEFESFRNIAFISVGMEPVPSNSRLKILVFRSRGEFSRFAPEDSIGYFSVTSSGPRMVMSNMRNSTQSRESILYHEYIHYLMQEHFRFRYPRWFGEGLAEVYGATTIERDVATLGALAQTHTYTFANHSPFKIRELLDPDFEGKTETYTTRFYAYAWLFMHYLQLSSVTDNQHLPQQLAQYIVRYSNGEDSVEAFEASFGMTPEEMDELLSDYRRQREFTVVSIPVAEYQGEIVKRELGEGEKNFLLAENAWISGEEEIALRYLRDIDHEDKSFAPSIALAAVLENHKDNSEVAHEYATSALNLDPENGLVHTNLSHLYSDIFEGNLEAGASDRNFLDRSLEHGERAVALDPAKLEALGQYSRALRNAGESVKALEVMMAAYQLEPASVSVNYDVGEYLIYLERPDLARPFLERAFNWTHSDQMRERIRNMLGDITSQADDN